MRDVVCCVGDSIHEIDTSTEQVRNAHLVIMLGSDGEYRIVKDRDAQEFTQPELAVLYRLATIPSAASGRDLAVLAGVGSNQIGARLSSLRKRGYVEALYSWRHRCMMWKLVSGG